MRNRRMRVKCWVIGPIHVLLDINFGRLISPRELQSGKGRRCKVAGLLGLRELAWLLFKKKIC